VFGCCGCGRHACLESPANPFWKARPRQASETVIVVVAHLFGDLFSDILNVFQGVMQWLNTNLPIQVIFKLNFHSDVPRSCGLEA